VALARALAVDPRVLLLDEPFGALDANVRRDLRRWLRDVHDDLGITTLFVTHDQEEALDLADRVVILNEGRIVQVGTPEDVSRRPNSRFVVTFLGDTNRLATTVRDGAARFGDYAFPAGQAAEGRSELLARPGDLEWRWRGAGIPARISRIIDRPGGRRLIAVSENGESLEIDTGPEWGGAAGDRGFVAVLRGQVFPAA
jgi:sulfate transport system ATP-binding protein